MLVANCKISHSIEFIRQSIKNFKINQSHNNFLQSHNKFNQSNQKFYSLTSFFCVSTFFPIKAKGNI